MHVGYNKTTETVIELPDIPEDIPYIIDDFSLASHLNITNKTLWYMLIDTRKHYKVFTIPKRNGGIRKIYDPNPVIRHCHTQILENILNPLQKKLGDHVRAYRHRLNIKDTIKRHIPYCEICENSPRDKYPANHKCPRRGTYIHIDLVDFFKSTKGSWIRNYFKRLGYAHTVSNYLSTLLTVRNIPNPYYKTAKYQPKYKTGVPQGAPASGAICNLIANNILDHKILNLLEKQSDAYGLKGVDRWVYSRYADDMTLTCGTHLKPNEIYKLLHNIYNVIRFSGYLPNTRKTRISVGIGRRRALGLIFNMRPNIERSEYFKLRAIIHNCNKYGFESQVQRANKKSAEHLLNWLSGQCRWNTFINKHKGDLLTNELNEAIQKHAINPQNYLTQNQGQN